MRKPPGHHLDFFVLLEALQQVGCAACRLADQAGRRFLQTLFYEQVTDGIVRARLRRAGGFCREHTRLALKLGDALGSSIIYGDLLGEASRSLGGKSPARSCLVCQAGAEAARRGLKVLTAHLADADVLAAYQEGDGLCLDHLGQILGSKRSPDTAGTLLQIERERLQRLAEDCAEFVVKSDYRRIGETLGPERDAWQRAARKLGGGFPNDGA